MVCSICKSPIRPEEDIKQCEYCNYEFHSDCWTENNGCGTPGCQNLPKPDEKDTRDFLEDTPWTTERKSCPICAEMIPVNSSQCPYCNQKFDDPTLLSPGTRNLAAIHAEREKQWRKVAILIFAASLFGIFAPFILLFGGAWFYTKRVRLKTESPSLYFLTIAGLILSIFYTLILITGIILK